MHAELQAKGKKIGKNRVAKLMQKTCLRVKQKRRFWHTTNSKHKDPIAPNILKRDFTPKAPNQAWVTDVTYVHTGEGWLYLTVMLDLFSRRVVGWTASATNDTALALSALQRALAARKPAPGLVHHSDRGAPYASAVYRQKLLAHGLVPSMSRSGDCWDNAVVESFFASLKAELVHHERYPTHAAALASIGDYINNFYNPLRRNSHLNYLNPVEYELRAQITALAAWSNCPLNRGSFNSSTAPFGVPYPGLAPCPGLDCARGSGVPPGQMNALFSVSSEFGDGQSVTASTKAIHGLLGSYQYAGKYNHGSLGATSTTAAITTSYAATTCAVAGSKTGTYTGIVNGGANATVYVDQHLSYYPYYGDFSLDTNSYIWNVGVTANTCSGNGVAPRLMDGHLD